MRPRRPGTLVAVISFLSPVQVLSRGIMVLCSLPISPRVISPLIQSLLCVVIVIVLVCVRRMLRLPSALVRIIGRWCGIPGRLCVLPIVPCRAVVATTPPMPRVASHAGTHALVFALLLDLTGATAASAAVITTNNNTTSPDAEKWSRQLSTCFACRPPRRLDHEHPRAPGLASRHGPGIVYV